MSLQTPIAKARGLGSAKGGSHHWWLQRLTAIMLIPLSLWFIYCLVVIAGAEYHYVIAWLQSSFNAVLMLLFIIVLYYHACLGIQVVIEDYIESKWQKMTCLILVKCLAFLAVSSTIVAILRIHMGFLTYG